MANTAALRTGATEINASWAPMICIAPSQALMSFNVASLPVAMSGMVNSFNVPPTTAFQRAVSGSPKELAGDVGSVRGTTSNLAAAIGTALSGAVLVGLLSSFILSSLVSAPLLKADLTSQVNLDNNITFVSNDRLLATLERTTLSPEQVTQAVQINTDARLRALKIGLLLAAAMALVAIFPATRLPKYRPGEIPSNPPLPKPRADEDD